MSAILAMTPMSHPADGLDIERSRRRRDLPKLSGLIRHKRSHGLRVVPVEVRGASAHRTAEGGHDAEPRSRHRQHVFEEYPRPFQDHEWLIRLEDWHPKLERRP